MLNWVLQLLVFDEVNCVFIDNDQDLQYKKLNWFWSVKSFLYSGVQLQRPQAKRFLQVVSYIIKTWSTGN